jgi:hypothetical protein
MSVKRKKSKWKRSERENAPRSFLFLEQQAFPRAHLNFLLSKMKSETTRKEKNIGANCTATCEPIYQIATKKAVKSVSFGKAKNSN